MMSETARPLLYCHRCIEIVIIRVKFSDFSRRNEIIHKKVGLKQIIKLYYLVWNFTMIG